MTNIPLSLFQSLKPSRTRPRTVLHLAGTKIERPVTSYAEVKNRRPFFLVNSQGLIEIAGRQASAAAAPGAKPGDPVRIRLEP